MRVETEAGTYTAVRYAEGSRTLLLTGLDPESVAALADGLEAVSGREVVPTHGGLGLFVDEDAFAQWLSFEALHYIDYTEFV